MIEATDVRLVLGEAVALAGVSVAVTPGEVVALTGASGSGKSSLLHCLAGISRPTSGQVVIDGADLSDMSEAERAAVRRTHLGFVFQFGELVPELTLRENVSLPLEINGVPRRKRTGRVDELLDLLDIARQADSRPAQVSGGQAQRAAIARALVHRPSYVLADEPTGALDSKNGEIVLHMLLELASDQGTAVVVATHDPVVAAAAGRRVALADGLVVAHEPGRT